MANTISIELSAEDRARLDRVAAAMERLVAHGLPCYMDPRKAETQSADILEAKAAAEVIPDPIPTDGPFPDPEPAQEAYKLADIQSKVVQLSAAGKKAEVREIVKAYAEKVSAIPEDTFGEVMAKLAGLEG